MGRPCSLWRPLGEINERIPEIIELADLQAFADAPLNVCSSGMKTRLGFGIAISAEPDIFVVDEVSGAGGAQFIPRAYFTSTRSACENGKVVIHPRRDSRVVSCN